MQWYYWSLNSLTTMLQSCMLTITPWKLPPIHPSVWFLSYPRNCMIKHPFFYYSWIYLFLSHYIYVEVNKEIKSDSMKKSNKKQQNNPDSIAVSSRLWSCRYCCMDALLGRWQNGWRRSSTAIIQECCEQYWTGPGSNAPHDANCTATYLLSWKL